MVGGLTAMLRFLGPATIVSALTATAGLFENVPWWTLPLVALAAFYLSLTAGMAWERALSPQVEVGPLDLIRGDWEGKIGLFYVPIKNGPVPATIKIRINGVVSSGVPPLEHSQEGHWRGLRADFDGTFAARERAQYGLIGVGPHPGSRNPSLFIWGTEGRRGGQLPIISPDAPLDQQVETRIDILVNCETADKQLGKPQELSLYVSPDPASPVGYKVVTKGMLSASGGWAKVGPATRFLFDRICTTIERIFGSRRNPPS
jgi:hypothetical protein